MNQRAHAHSGATSTPMPPQTMGHQGVTRCQAPTERVIGCLAPIEHPWWGQDASARPRAQLGDIDANAAAHDDEDFLRIRQAIGFIVE